jgi:NADPH-dependent 2,4-dienoyl-CoA reductase/sulfur reductase-like enzyme
VQRRDFLYLSGLATLGAISTKCYSQRDNGMLLEDKSMREKTQLQKGERERVVIVGGGFGGMNTATSIKQNDPENKIEVILIEKNSHYFACPMSNALLSGSKEFQKENFMFYYWDIQKKYNIEVVHSEVIDINREIKNIETTKENIPYDYLVLAPGIVYDYKTEFYNWDDAKINRAKIEAPGGLISDGGVEHANLLAQLEEFKNAGGEGEIVIIPQRTKLYKNLEESVVHKSLVRCAPASYERACMIGDWIKRNNLVGKAKVVILDSSSTPQAKGVAFLQTFKDFYEGIIEYIDGFDLIDVDFDTKEIFFKDLNDNLEYYVEKRKYSVLNLIPLQKASPLIEIAGLETNEWGGAILAKRKLYSISDSSVYVIGDSAVFEKGVYRDNPKRESSVPPAAQTAYNLGKEAGRMIAQKILASQDIFLGDFSAGCFSIVQTKPEKYGISIHKNFSYDSKGNMIIDEDVGQVNGKYYNTIAGHGIVSWFYAVTGDTFVKF